MNILSIITEATCGEACWEAREDLCKCSCGGKNHGCLRTPEGIKPVRTSKIDGYRYELKEIGSYSDILTLSEEMLKTFPPKRIEKYKANTFDENNKMIEVEKEYSYTWKENDSGSPVRMKPASVIQIQNWIELSHYKSMDRFTLYCNKPYFLWVKVQ